MLKSSIENLCSKSLENVKCDSFFSFSGRDFDSKQYWEIIDKFSGGAEGDIYTVRNDSGNLFLFKFIRNAKNRIRLKQEICYQNISFKLGLSPKVIDAWYCDQSQTKGALVMTKFGNFDLDTYLKLLQDKSEITFENWIQILSLINIFLLVVAKTCILNSNGIFHNDLHLGNILVEEKDFNVSIIDFGRSESWEETIDILFTQPTNKDSLEEYYDKIQRVYKSIYADRLSPFIFLKEKLQDNSNTLFSNVVEFILNNLYSDIHEKYENIRFASWELSIEDLSSNLWNEFEDYFVQTIQEYSFEMNENDIEKLTEFLQSYTRIHNQFASEEIQYDENDVSDLIESVQT